MRMARREYVIHLPIQAASSQAAALIARTVGHALALFHSIDTRDITLTDPTEPEVVHRVFCGLPLPGGRRCVLLPGHSGACNRRTAR